MFLIDVWTFFFSFVRTSYQITWQIFFFFPLSPVKFTNCFHCYISGIMKSKYDRANNYCLDWSMTTQYPIVLEVLKGHYLSYALSKSVSVPDVYLTQLWNTIHFNNASPNNLEHFEFFLTHENTSHRLTFNLPYLRQALRLPDFDEIQGKSNFDPLPENHILFQQINALGYEGGFDNIKSFKRKKLHRLWCTMFSILNRCLTPANLGIDGATIPILQIFFGVVYNRHLDYADIFWNQLHKIVIRKSHYSYIPFSRFLSIILRCLLRDNPRIPRLKDVPTARIVYMQRLAADTGSLSVDHRMIPMYLLKLADQESKVVSDYLALKAKSKPTKPSPGASVSTPGEGSTRKGLKRKRNESSEEEVVEVREDDDDQSENSSDSSDKSDEDSSDASGESGDSEKNDDDDDDDLDDDDDDQPQSPQPDLELRTKKKHSARVPSPEPQSSSETSKSPTHEPQDEPIPMETDVPFNDELFDFPSFEAAHGEEETVVGEHLESPPRVTKSRATDVPTGLHELQSSIEKDDSCPLSHAQTLPSHSVSSQQGTVSLSHGDIPRTLPTSHSEMVGIETRGSLPQPLTFIRTRKKSISPKTQVSGLSDYAHLSDVAGTVVEATTLVVSRGSTGNPANVNITPALTAGLLPQVHEVSGYERSGDTAQILSVYEGPRYERSGDTASAPSVGVSGQTGSLSDPVVISTSLHRDDRVYERLGDTGHGHSQLEQSQGCKALDRTVISTGNPASVVELSGHTAGPCDSVVVSTRFNVSGTSSSVLPPFIVDSHFQERMSHRYNIHTSSPATQTPPITATTRVSSRQPPFFTVSQQTSPFAPSTSSQSTNSLVSFSSLSLTEMQVLFHAKLLTSSDLTPTQSTLLAILNSSIQSPSNPDSIFSQYDSLEKRVSNLEQSCRPSAFSFSTSRHDDPDSEDQHEGENRRGLSFPGVPSSFGEQQDKQQERGTTSGSGGKPNDEEDVEMDYEEIYNVEPLNVIYPALMIEHNKEVNEKEFESDFSQDFSIATEGGMSSFVQRKETAIDIDSDDDEVLCFEDIYLKDVKEEEEEEMVNEEVDVEKEHVLEQFEDIDRMFQAPPPKSSHASTSVTPVSSSGFGHLIDEEGEINEGIFNEIVPPNEEVILELEKEVGVSSTPKKKTNEGKFYKSRLVQLDLENQQLRKTLREPFIEEQAYKIFSKTEKQPHRFNVISSVFFKDEEGLRNEYQTLMRRMMIQDEENLKDQRKFRIKNVIEIDCVKLARVIVPRFHVYRTNNKRYLFSEADFHILPLNDLMFIYDYMRNAILKPWAVQVASGTVKRYMKALIETSAFQDFQLGLESVKRKINVTVPNQTLPQFDLEGFPVCMVLVEPEKGFVLRNGKGKKNFIRLSELHKYSDGTLALAYKCFHTLLESKQATQDQIPLIEDVMDKIHGRLFLRVQIRQVEICRGYRKKMFYKGSKFIEGYNQRGRKEPFDPLGPYLPNDPRNQDPRSI